jgi:hypothetical protein
MAGDASRRDGDDPAMSIRPQSGRDALAEAARIGPFFAVTVDPGGAGWVRFADVAADRGRVSASVASARAALAATHGVADDLIDPRAAASIWHLGVAARLASPALAAAALAGWTPRLDALLCPSGGPTAFAIRRDDIAGSPVAGAVEAARAVHAHAVRVAIEPVTTTVAGVASVSEHVLWGNVWSAFAGAAIVLAAARPSSGPAAEAIVRTLVATSPYPMAGGYGPSGRFRRDTCCLYYRLPRGGLCGDCVLDRVPTSAPQAP